MPYIINYLCKSNAQCLLPFPSCCCHPAHTCTGPVRPHVSLGNRKHDARFAIFSRHQHGALSDTRYWHITELVASHRAALVCAISCFFKQALIELAPPVVQARLGQRGGTDTASWNELVAAALSVMCGAATHLLWNGFTHQGTIIVDSFPGLKFHFGTVVPYKIFTYSILQLVSTVAGLALGAKWSWLWYRRTAPEIRAMALTARSRWVICGLLTIVPPAIGSWVAWSGGWDMARLPEFVLTTLPVFFCLFTANALVQRLRCNQTLS